MSDYTSAIGHYDGIFKSVHSPDAKKLFLKARALLAVGDTKASRDLLGQCREVAETCPEDVATVNLLLKELDRLKMSKIPAGVLPVDSVDWSDACKRKLVRLDEPLAGLPQGVFVLRIPYEGSMTPVRFLGRKLMSEKWQGNQIPELFCSIIRAEMILGIFVDFRVTEHAYTIFYRPLTPSEKVCVFADVVGKYDKTADAVYPFPLLKKDSKREFGSPVDGWSIDDTFEGMLSHGELHFRRFAVKYISTLRLNKPRFYDPACSTGVFLASMKAAFPDSHTIGQDLSQDMVEVSKARVDEVHCRNAMWPMIDPGSADVVFVRFLNSEVIRTKEAEELLKALQPIVRRGGHMMIFGHTPVLVSTSDFEDLNDFTLLSSIGVTEDESGIFQYYILQRN